MERRNFIKITGGTGAFLFFATPGALKALAQSTPGKGLENSFANPLRSDGPWVVWHWTSANQTKEGVTSNLEGMAAAGIAGATLFSFPPSDGFRGSTLLENPAAPLTPEWFDLINHAVTEAGRLGIELAIQISAGWATAGGDWIPPELSQQQIVWSEQIIDGGKRFRGTLVRPRRVSVQSGGFGEGEEQIPESWDNYYRDLNVLAFREPEGWGETSFSRNAKITSTLPVSDIQKLADPGNREGVVDTDREGYIQFEFAVPFTLRSVAMNPGQYNRPAHSMEVQASDDGINFIKIGNLEPMMNSWQTRLPSLTHTVPQTKAKYFRLVYHPGPPIGYDEHMQAGSFRGGGMGFGQPAQAEEEPKEMLDTIEKITITSVVLSSTAVVHHWEGKTALVWGKSRRITGDEMPAEACVPVDGILDITDKMNPDGSIDWKAPEGKWRIMRFGYTTMARTNGSGIGQGLEADKFSREGARIAFEGWYGRILEEVGPRLSHEVVKMLNVDSWECGSQNWSPVFREEFRARRGYDVDKYLLLMAGIPVENADVTEGFLFDVRRTIADLISDNFFEELKELAHSRGSIVNTEAVPPGMMSDGVLVHKNVDATSSEFWVDAWQNWKPCDIADAASGAHIYGKQIVIAEAFTGGGSWKENPYDLKAMGDMHFVDGVNRMMLHLWAAQPYPGRVPGQTGAAGTYINEHTTWIKPGKAWFDYLRRCQSLLQSGKPVSDALYFIGEDVPCRALIPPRYGSYYVTEPALPEGYDYDSINQDALLNLTAVKDGKIVLPGGVCYEVLVLRPDRLMTPQAVNRIRELVAEGAQVVGPRPLGSPGMEMADVASEEVRAAAEELWGNMDGKNITGRVYGSGRIFWGLPMEEVMDRIKASPDVLFMNQRETMTGKPYKATAYEPDGVNPTQFGADRKGWGLMWNHRTNEGNDFYFLSNQEQIPLSTEISIRQSGRVPEFWHPDTGLIEDVPVWSEENGRTIVPYEFDPSGSVFIMFRRSARDVNQVVEVTSGKETGGSKLNLKITPSGLEKWATENGNWKLLTKSGRTIDVIADGVPDPVQVDGTWNVAFPLLTGEVKQAELMPGSWTDQNDEDVKYFSGTATYTKVVQLTEAQIADGKRLFLDLGDIGSLAEIKVNGKSLGVSWKPPYRVEITDVAVDGSNKVEIRVTNTWFNRLTKDAGLPEGERRTWVAGGGWGRGMQAGAALMPSGLLGPVTIRFMVKA